MQHRAKKRFGQNFLVDTIIIQRIIDSINPQPDDRMIEIGPGLGALTIQLLKHVNQLDVIELDRDVIPELLKNCKSYGTPVIHEIDVLKFDFTDFYNHSDDPQKLRVVGNLPYNISTAVLFLLLKHRDVIRDMHFMLQKEVVERITATPGSKVYGRLSVMMQAYFKVTALFLVPPQAFRPAPKVESAILRVIPDDHYSSTIKNHKIFEDLVRESFAQRRKTLKNNLKSICSLECIQAANLDPNQRAEELSVDDYIRLYQQIV